MTATTRKHNSTERRSDSCISGPSTSRRDLFLEIGGADKYPGGVGVEPMKEKEKEQPQTRTVTAKKDKPKRGGQ